MTRTDAETHLKMAHPMVFNVDPGTLKSAPLDTAAFSSLYRNYGDDLKLLCEDMCKVRSQMLQRRCCADFSDRESELLYLVVRDQKPDVVVEISPCHGYSTNYLLAALTDNHKGVLHSYEIVEQVHGRPITEVITKNLSHRVDCSRLQLHIGDARKADIPACDLLFIDSCHEAYFASWYFTHLIQKPKLVFMHDVLIFADRYKTVVPKAAFLSAREQYYVLESLALNGQRCSSVAEWNYYMDPGLKKLPVRYEGSPAERSILFPGHEQTVDATRLHIAQPLIEEARRLVLLGNREEALERIDDVIKNDHPLFSKLQALTLLPQMGYRYPLYRHLLPALHIEYKTLTISTFALLLEFAVTSYQMAYAREIIKRARISPVQRGAYRYLSRNYLNMFDARRQQWVTRASRFPMVAKIARAVRNAVS